MEPCISRLSLDEMVGAASIYQYLEDGSPLPSQFVKNYFEQMLYTHNEVWGAFDGELVAFIAFGLHEDDGWIEELCVHPDHQRRGIGTALISVAKERRKALEAISGKDVEFYKKCGFVYLKTSYQSVKPVVITLDIYRWTNLTAP